MPRVLIEIEMDCRRNGALPQPAETDSRMMWCTLLAVAMLETVDVDWVVMEEVMVPILGVPGIKEGLKTISEETLVTRRSVATTETLANETARSDPRACAWRDRGTHRTALPSRGHI